MKKKCAAIAGILAVILSFTMTPLASAPFYAEEKPVLPPSINMGADILKTNAGLAGAQTVRFVGRMAGENEHNQWDVIAYDGKDGNEKDLTYVNGAGQEETLYNKGTVTLLYKEENWKLDFGIDFPLGGYTTNNTYSTSFLRTFLKSYEEGYPLECAAILPRDLKGQEVNNGEPGFDANLIKGADVTNVKMWPLSEAEVLQLPDEIRGGKNHWWLRTPGFKDSDIAFVYVNGAGNEAWVDYGSTVTETQTALSRQAVNLNKNAICFTCATNNGKASGEIGPDALIEVNTTSENDWTLTLYDDGRIPGLEGHKDFKVTDSSYDPTTETVFLKYEGAPKVDPEDMYAPKEYVSAILQGKDGKIKYYGRLAEVTGEETTKGEVNVHLAGKRTEGDKLFVFSERICSNTLRTEFASKLYELPTSVPEKEPEKKDQKAAGKADGILLPQMKAKGKTSLSLTWNKVQGAAGYDVFFGAYNNHAKNLKKVKTVKAGKALQYTRKGLKKKTAYSAYVKAFVYKNGKKKYVSVSEKVFAFTSGGNAKYSNPKNISVNKTKYTLKKGKTAQIRAKVNLLHAKKKGIAKRNKPFLRYISSNIKVATVSETGKIKARGKGTCKLFVYAANGVRRTLTVTVK